jgi:hypothetical protein
MPSSHNSPSKPSSILALICLALVHRLRPDWVAVAVSEAAAAEGVNPQRLSRLATRALPAFEATAAGLSRRGRPPADRAGAEIETELSVTGGLLAVATAILGQVSLRKPAVRALVAGAYRRLVAEHGVTQKTFCAALALSTRTLRSWLDRAASPAEAADPVERDGSPSKKKTKKRPPRRGRFGFDVTVPETQIAADTTDLSAFGVPLKLIAAQDVGGRDADLLSSVIVSDHESAELVARVLSEALDDLPGAQAITDQGTPYLAEHTRAALDELEVEHAVQREADPLGKATIERAFGSVKALARPLLGLTDRLAAAVPTLAKPALARALTILLITALLRAYQAGARAARRADDARANVDQAALVRAAEQARERARADDQSARLLLEHIHTAYQIGGARQAFVRSFRRFALPALRAAERTFAAQAHRDDIKNRTAYFARLVRIADDQFREDQARRWRERDRRDRFDRERKLFDDQHQRWRDDPTAHLADALDAVAAHYIDGRLLFDGVGPGTAWMRISIDRLAAAHGADHARDIADGVFAAFARATSDRLGPDGIAAVHAVLNRHLPRPNTDNTPSCAARFAAIVGVAGLKPRPPPSNWPC